MMYDFTFKDRYGEYHHCEFIVNKYVGTGNLSVEIWSPEEGPITKVTVNTDGVSIPEGYIAVKDYSENEGMVEWLISQDLIIDDVVTFIESGFIHIPVFKLTDKGKEAFKS